ncbi:MAG TPA: fused MFS/spermidine synthase, partial [Anaeromyxobacteraceae bacterium]|nr:fused MFS/spermidine synthase [Anaeromyxobacteraceae bacterium]
FGASHLAVTTVLAVYMGGQALGSRLFGDRADRTRRPLRLYGLLELGIAAAALAFLGLMKIYPAVYGPLARLAETNVVWLTVLRAGFAVVAMAVPTTLMGGTLPVLTRHAVRRGEGIGGQLSFLYAFNTLGAVAGTALAGFVLLENLGVVATLLLAAATSASVGTVAVVLGRRAAAAPGGSPTRSPATAHGAGASALARRLTLLGIGVSGFCALGYEILWTRMLTLVMGTSVYSFTLMLVAFLAGIGLGSHGFALLRTTRWARPGGRGSVVLFGATQLAIGASALAATVLMRDLPQAASRLQAPLVGLGGAEFGGRLVATLAVAFAFMFVPAFFMGLAFPAAGAVWSAEEDEAGGAVGRLLGSNTVGAILGSVASGYALVYLFGIERSLQMLVVVNAAMGFAVVLADAVPRRALAAIPALAAVIVLARGLFPGWGRVWDRDFFAAFTNNTRNFDTPESIRRKNIEVLYYHEGVDETVSVIRPKGTVQTFIVNGRPEASTAPGDMQVQRTLGHLPMLLHPRPRSVFVLGTGTGMTLGAVSLHPEAERIVLGEIEESMLGVARTFDRWNDHVLDDPRLRIVFNDGRNFLSTTHERFDVMTADPVHPWSGGAGYLYTREYFRAVADRLAPGGIACQWLPMYELSVKDVQTVLRTFSESFEHVVVWLTYWDAVLVGSRSPIRIDEAAIRRRLDSPAMRADLAPIHMATAEDFLSYFLMGTAGARAFGAGGDVNTDDNLVLEFSAPASQGITGLDGDNVRALAAHRENLEGFLAPAGASGDDPARRARWDRQFEIGSAFDAAHAAFLQGEHRSPRLDAFLASLQASAPEYAPLRFLLEERGFWERIEPALVTDATFDVPGAGGSPAALRLAAVRQFLGRERVLVSFVDNARREVYGQRYVDGTYEELDAQVSRFVAETFQALRTAVA